MYHSLTETISMRRGNYHNLVSCVTGVSCFFFNTASLQVIKLTEETIIMPPAITKGSIFSLKNNAPTEIAQINCKKVTGCVTVTGAAIKALVIV